MVASIVSDTLQIEPKNTTLKIGNTKVGLLINSRSVCNILKKPLATEFINNSCLTRWFTTAPSKDLKTFVNEPIPMIGMMQMPVESNGWRIEDAEFVVVIDGLKPLIDRDLFDAPGISVTQTPNSVESNMIKNITIRCPSKTRIAYQFPQLISCIGRSKVHNVKLKFHRHYQPKHQKR